MAGDECTVLNILCFIMNELTCLTLETFPAGGTVAGVWSQTLATIFTLLQTDSYSEKNRVRLNSVCSSFVMWAEDLTQLERFNNDMD